MSVFVEELAGSPYIQMDRKGGSAKRIVKVADSDVTAFILEVFPGALSGYPFSASFPGLPWLKAETISIEPWSPDDMAGNNDPLNTYPEGRKITVDYKPSKYDQQMQSGSGNDKSGPGCGSGSTGGQNTTFVTHDVTLGVEALTNVTNAFAWGNDTNGNPVVPSMFNPTPNKQTDPTGVQASILIPNIQHTITWNFVPFPPWPGIRYCLGKVNTALFAGAPAGVVLFLGAQAKRAYSTSGTPYWNLTYKLSEKWLNAPAPGDSPTLPAKGWNYFLRPQTGKFELLTYKNGSPVFPSADFKLLFVLSSC